MENPKELNESDEEAKEIAAKAFKMMSKAKEVSDKDGTSLEGLSSEEVSSVPRSGF